MYRIHINKRILTGITAIVIFWIVFGISTIVIAIAAPPELAESSKDYIEVDLYEAYDMPEITFLAAGESYDSALVSYTELSADEADTLSDIEYEPAEEELSSAYEESEGREEEEAESEDSDEAKDNEDSEKEETEKEKTDEKEKEEKQEEETPKYTYTDIDKTVYATAALNIRSGPSKDFDVVSYYKFGAEIKVTGECNETGWYRVSYDGKTGYVSSSVTSTSKPASSSATTSEKNLLAAIIFCEAGAGNGNAQIAVGAVVMNRVKSKSFPNSISGVIYQSGQFTPARNGSLSRALNNGNYKKCLGAAEAALAGEDPTGGCLYFLAAWSTNRSGINLGGNVFFKKW